MPTEVQRKQPSQEQVRIIKLHKRRADRFTLLWLGFALLLLTGFQVVLDHFAIAAAERTGRDDTTGAADTDCRCLAGCWAGSRRGSHAYEGHQSGAIAYDAGL